LPPTVTLYFRPDCHLCDEARDAIATLTEGRRDIELREVDIESSDELHRRYLERIPVIEIEGKVVSELEPDLTALRAALDTLVP
jgi:glutaredoxin